MHPLVEVATCARDHIRGLRPSPSKLEAFRVREVFMSLRPESLLLEHGDSNRLWSMIGGFNSVLDMEGACILSTTPIGVRVPIKLFLSLNTELSSITESWSFFTFKMSVKITKMFLVILHQTNLFQNKKNIKRNVTYTLVKFYFMQAYI